MSKPSRRPNRRDRPRRVRTVASGARLHVVVATQPRPARASGVDLTHEVALVKAALLYADTVELVSPAAALLQTARALESATVSDALNLLSALDPTTLGHLGGGGLPTNWRDLVQVAQMLNALPPTQRSRLTDGADQKAIAELLSIVRGFEDHARQLCDVSRHPGRPNPRTVGSGVRHFRGCGW